MKNFIAYYRVSTAKQGASGLGLEAQRECVAQFIGARKAKPEQSLGKPAAGAGDLLLAEYTEVESGKKNTRPELRAAIDHAKRAGAILVIAKLDRLSRNVAFIFALRDSGVDFACADMPDANTLTIGIFAALAQHERELISQRTKAALAAKKARGCTLGTLANLTDAGRKLGAQRTRENARANEANRRARAMILHLRVGQNMPMHAIAQYLNENGFRTVRGKTFFAATVRHVMKSERNEAKPDEAKPLAPAPLVQALPSASLVREDVALAYEENVAQ
jgi:DNA invertase Pin-like site-specific DNA recombinase